jgi:hypothetical protein
MRNQAALSRPARLAPALLFAVMLAGALLLAGTARAQVYKYTDANGQVHYADRAPSNATQIQGPTPPQTPAAPAARPTPANTPAASAAPPPPLPVSSQQAQQVQRDVATARVEQCKTAKENYDKAVRAQRVYHTNDKGERVYVTAAEADALRLQMKAEMDGACGS